MKSPSRSGLSFYAAKITEFLASVIVHRTKTLIVAALAIAALSIFIVVKRRNFDSEVLNLLPSKFESVVGLKEFNNQFAQARQLVFGFLGETGHAEDLDAFKTHFIEELAKEPWVLRTFDRIPLETQEGLNEIQGILPALLLNLPRDEFNEAMSQLESAAIDDRLTRIRDTITGDSIRSQLEATLDPLGLFARAMTPFGSSSSMDQGSALASQDGLFEIALIITNQPGLDARSCQAVMEKVNRFTDRMLNEWTGYRPKVYVTGRTAFVAQISHSVEGDISLSAILSIGIVSGLFYVAFRRFLPLIGIVLILCLSALVALALGMLVFHELNVVAIGFFSILAGVGVDFSLLLFGRYQQARRAGQSHEDAVFVSVRDIGAAIFYVIVTTAIGFLVLKFRVRAVRDTCRSGGGIRRFVHDPFPVHVFSVCQTAKNNRLYSGWHDQICGRHVSRTTAGVGCLPGCFDRWRVDRCCAIRAAKIRHQPGFTSAKEDSGVDCATGVVGQNAPGIGSGHHPGQRERPRGI